MRNFRLNVQNALIQFSFYAGFCAVIIYSSLYLRDKGFPVELLGTLLAAGNFVGVFVQQKSAEWADRSSRLTVREIAALQILFPALIMLPLIFFNPARPFLALAILVTAGFELGSQSILNTIALIFESTGYRISFSVIRGFGSIGFAIASLWMGDFFYRNSADYLPVVEIIPLFTYFYLRKKKPDRFWLAISAIFFSIKGLFLTLAGSAEGVYFAQHFQILSYGLFTPAFGYFAHRIVDPADMAQGQAVTLQVAIFGGAFGNLLAGATMGSLGVTLSLAIATAISAIGTVIFLVGLHHYSGSDRIVRKRKERQSC